MKASDYFLKYYVKDLDVSGKDFSEAITLTGTKIETYSGNILYRYLKTY